MIDSVGFQQLLSQAIAQEQSQLETILKTLQLLELIYFQDVLLIPMETFYLIFVSIQFPKHHQSLNPHQPMDAKL
jgi:hypothetical protein